MSKAMGFLGDYVEERLSSIKEDEIKSIFVCSMIENVKKVLERLVAKGREGAYMLIDHDGNPFSYVVTRKGATTPTRLISVGEMVGIAKASVCLENFRNPVTVFAYESMEHLPKLTAILIYSFAGRELYYRTIYELYEKRKKEKGKSISQALVELHIKAFKKRYEAVKDTDLLSIAIERCMTKNGGRNSMMLIGDLLRFASTKAEKAVYADGEERENIVFDYTLRNCPSNSLTIINMREGYVFHATDAT